MKDLSVVIVNYNVEYFLEQCLLSVEKAAKNIDAEIFVVDNNSVDGSVNLVKEKFPFVKLIENKKNFKRFIDDKKDLSEIEELFKSYYAGNNIKPLIKYAI